MKGFDPFDGKLTETGLYHITVDVNLMASNRTQGKFRLSLTRYRVFSRRLRSPFLKDRGSRRQVKPLDGLQEEDVLGSPQPNPPRKRRGSKFPLNYP